MTAGEKEQVENKKKKTVLAERRRHTDNTLIYFYKQLSTLRHCSSGIALGLLSFSLPTTSHGTVTGGSVGQGSRFTGFPIVGSEHVRNTDTKTKTWAPTVTLTRHACKYLVRKYTGCTSGGVVIVQELCESRGGRPGLSVLTSLLVSVDVKIYWTVLRHWSQLVPNMSADIWGH